MPASRSLGDALFELRFDLTRVAWRITYLFAHDRRIVLPTVFRKQRQNERHEVQRARQAMNRASSTMTSSARLTVSPISARSPLE